jgi:ribosomal-protein-alanine N-acetyltransferase
VSELVTERLQLRQWRDSDRGVFAALNADPEVMRYFPAPLTRAQSDAFVDRIRDTIDRHGWGLWAVEDIAAHAFVGFVGLNRPGFQAHFTPAIEVGWRLDRQHWGKGYATEAAAAALQYGFERLQLEEIVSFTAAINERSTRVMSRLGMNRDAADDFENESVPEGQLRHRVLYRISKSEWTARPAVACRLASREAT